MKSNHIHLASFPRSGNKFAQQILHHVFGLKCRSIYPVPEYPDEIAPTWNGVEANVIIKTHELWSCETGIYVVRDPRDVYCSFSRYQTHLKGRLVSAEDLISDPASFADYCFSWTDHLLSWRKPGVHVLKYEDLLSDPIGAMKAALSFFAIDVLEIGTIPDWSQLNAGCHWYYQVGKAGRWKMELPQVAIDLCEQVNGKAMRELGYL